MNVGPFIQLIDAAWLFLMAAMGIAGGMLVRHARPSGINSLLAAAIPIFGMQCQIAFC